MKRTFLEPRPRNKALGCRTGLLLVEHQLIRLDFRRISPSMWVTGAPCRPRQDALTCLTGEQVQAGGDKQGEGRQSRERAWPVPGRDIFGKLSSEGG